MEIGDRIIRIDGCFKVGSVGTIIDRLDNRFQVKWDRGLKTWISNKSIALESIPYNITPYKTWKDYKGNYKTTYPKYNRLTDEV